VSREERTAIDKNNIFRQSHSKVWVWYVSLLAVAYPWPPGRLKLAARGLSPCVLLPTWWPEVFFQHDLGQNKHCELPAKTSALLCAKLLFLPTNSIRETVKIEAECRWSELARVGPRPSSLYHSCLEPVVSVGLGRALASSAVKVAFAPFLYIDPPVSGTVCMYLGVYRLLYQHTYPTLSHPTY
jgi:hypothetical protein